MAARLRVVPYRALGILAESMEVAGRRGHGRAGTPSPSSSACSAWVPTRRCWPNASCVACTGRGRSRAARRRAPELGVRGRGGAAPALTRGLVLYCHSRAFPVTPVPQVELVLLNCTHLADLLQTFSTVVWFSTGFACAHAVKINS